MSKLIKLNKNRIILSMLENVKYSIEKVMPQENKIISHVREAIILLCFKIEKEEERVIQ